MQYAEEMKFSNIESNDQGENSFYEPKKLLDRIRFFNFTIETCYKTCNNCNNILGNSNNHYCHNCSNEYPYIYLNGEKCIYSCKEMDLYEYKNECLNKCADNTFIDQFSYICYDDCKDNKNITRIITLNNTCIDKCPDGYILNEEMKICEKQSNNEEIPITTIIEETSREENFNSNNEITISTINNKEEISNSIYEINSIIEKINSIEIETIITTIKNEDINSANEEQEINTENIDSQEINNIKNVNNSDKEINNKNDTSNNSEQEINSIIDNINLKDINLLTKKKI